MNEDGEIFHAFFSLLLQSKTSLAGYVCPAVLDEWLGYQHVMGTGVALRCAACPAITKGCNREEYRAAVGVGFQIL